MYFLISCAISFQEFRLAIFVISVSHICYLGIVRLAFVCSYHLSIIILAFHLFHYD